VLQILAAVGNSRRIQNILHGKTAEKPGHPPFFFGKHPIFIIGLPPFTTSAWRAEARLQAQVRGGFNDKAPAEVPTTA
jgi:hypothetical protein